MAIAIPRLLVEFILLGAEDDRRQLQDSPVLGDVWLEFARDPSARLELLITPYKAEAAAAVARALSQHPLGNPKEGQGANVAYLQGIVAARLSFEELLSYIVPLTSWWNADRINTAMAGYIKQPSLMCKDIVTTFDQAREWFSNESRQAMQDVETRRRYVALTSLLLWAVHQTDAPDGSENERVRAVLDRLDAKQACDELKRVFKVMGTVKRESLVYSVSLNRRATAAVLRSVPAVKADAARTLFTVDCRRIVWAVVDSGIDAEHPAFRDPAEADPKKPASRVQRTLDFTRIREIVSLDNLNDTTRASRVAALRKRPLKQALTTQAADRALKQLANGASENRPIDWAIVERFVELDQTAKPPMHHGTHVAGILGASRKGALPVVRPRDFGDDWVDGMCPDIRLWDLRVLAPSLAETEFAIIAALQYIRYVNERNSYTTIHGANLSLSIPHDVRNYACGRTPICNECERLVASGVVVVAAAGNRGFQQFETNEGRFESYAAFSVTDPGNADGVITVGSTHRYAPHTFGVSFFSSRGPTGDGRIKPDLVAPGERIRAPIRDGGWGDLDGTSMAAPHVSGAAAMLMARYTELIGQPRRIKDLLCRTATDLGRERSFQGHGMLDVLRAFQSV